MRMQVFRNLRTRSEKKEKKLKWFQSLDCEKMTIEQILQQSKIIVSLELYLH